MSKTSSFLDIRLPCVACFLVLKTYVKRLLLSTVKAATKK